MELFDRIANEEIVTYLRGAKSKITVHPGKCRMNFRCQYNSVHEAIRKRQKLIAMCVYVNSGHAIIHFINVTKKGKFVDNTLGQWATQYEFFFIKYIDEVDFYNIDDVFSEYRTVLRRKLRFVTRLLSKETF